MNILIILHGWASSKERWQAVEEKIEKNGIKIIIPNLPGFRLDTSLNKVWNLDDYVRWLEDFCSDITEPFYLLGHSFGGRMAIKFAAEHPEKLKALILVSTAGIIHKQSQTLLTFLAGARFVKWISLKIPVLRNIFPYFRRIFYRYVLRKTDYLEAEKLPFLKETFQNIIKEDLTKYLSEIKVSTLIIWGDKDKMTPVADAYLMNKEIKNSKLEILEGIGHRPHRESPEIISLKIINFISK